MRAGTILFGGVDLGLYGHPQFTMRRSPDPAPPARPTRQVVELEVTQEIPGRTPATIQARMDKIQEALDAGEAVLELRGEHGASTQWRALCTGSTMPEVIAQGRGRLRMSFRASEPLAGDTGPEGLYTPFGDEDPVALQNIRSWSETIRTERRSTRAANRWETLTTLTLTARVGQAAPELDHAARLAALQARKGELEGLRAKSGTLVRGAYSQVVELESLQCTIDDEAMTLEATLQCRHTALPGDTQAEVDFTVESEDDTQAGEVRTTVAGTVLAPDYATAKAKVNALTEAWTTADRRVTRFTTRDRYLDGEDAAAEGATWVGMDFTIVYRAPLLGAASWTMRYETQEGPDGARIRATGRVSAADYATALAKAEELGVAAGLPQVGATITSETTSQWPPDGSSAFVGLDFSYEYATHAAALRGQLRQTTSAGLTSGRSVTVSGTLSSTSELACRTVAQALIPPGACLTQEEETAASATDAGGTAFTNFSFAYSWSTPATRQRAGYTSELKTDYAQMLGRRTISGTITAANETDARAVLAAITSGLGLTTEESFTTRADLNYGGTAVAKAYDFSNLYEESLVSFAGHDLIEASYTLARTGQVDHEPVNPAPATDPVRQPGMGWTVGKLVASGTCRARQQATARAWGQAKRAAAATYDGETGAERPPRETMRAVYRRFSSTETLLFEFGFTYEFEYAAALHGVWPAALTV